MKTKNRNNEIGLFAQLIIGILGIMFFLSPVLIVGYALSSPGEYCWDMGKDYDEVTKECVDI
jgi:hypothetical protein